jgi:hypothetical protein
MIGGCMYKAPIKKSEDTTEQRIRRICSKLGISTNAVSDEELWHRLYFITGQIERRIEDIFKANVR